VAKDYFALREEAIQHAQLRNKYFQRATEAYLKGDRASAKSYSMEGRFHQEQMRALHNEAAVQIFARRNKALGRSDQMVLDLHGLHVEEGFFPSPSFFSNKPHLGLTPPPTMV